MGKKFNCPKCKGEIAFWGVVPTKHRCGLCGEDIAIESEEAVQLDLNNNPVTKRRRTIRPGEQQ